MPALRPGALAGEAVAVSLGRAAPIMLESTLRIADHARRFVSEPDGTPT